MRIIAIYAGFEEIDTLSDLLKRLYGKFPKSTCVVIQPHTDLTDETQLYNDIAAISLFQVSQPILNKLIDKNSLYFISAQKQFLLQQGSFINFNFWSDENMSYINTFCRYLAASTNCQVAFVALHTKYSHFEEEKELLAAHGSYFASISDTLSAGFSQFAEQVCTQLEQKWLTLETKLPMPVVPKLLPATDTTFDISDYLQHSALCLLCIDLNLNIKKYTTSLSHHIPIDASFIDKPITALNLPEPFKFLLETAPQVLQTQIGIVNRLVYLPSGERYVADIYPAYESQGNQIKGVIIILSDQTENVRTKEQLEDMRLNMEQQGRIFWATKADWIKENIKNTLVVKKLDHQTELFYSILSRMAEGIIALDSQGRVSLINQSAMAILGIEDDSAGIDMAMWVDRHDFFDENNALIPQSHNPFLQTMHKDMSLPTEFLVKCKYSQQGCFLSVNVQMLPRGIDDDAEGRLIVITDISERKKAQLKERAIIEAVPDMMFTMDKKGVFLDIYIEKSSSMDYMRSFLVGNSVDDVYIEIAQHIHEAIENAINTQRLQTVEFRSVNDRKDRLEFNEIRISPIDQEQVLGLVRDITDIVDGKHTLEQSSRHYRELLDNVPIPIVLLDSQGNVIHHNSVLIEAMNLHGEFGMINKNVFDFIQKNVGRAKNGLNNLFREKVGNKVSKFEFTVNDVRFIVDVIGKLISYENKRVAQLSVLNIISTDLQKLPDKKSKNSLNDDFWGTVTFEFSSFKIHNYSKNLAKLLPTLRLGNLLRVFEQHTYKGEISGNLSTQHKLTHALAETEGEGRYVFDWTFEKNNLPVEVSITAVGIFLQDDMKLFAFSIINR